jgi:hypothetical protein
MGKSGEWPSYTPTKKPKFSFAGLTTIAGVTIAGLLVVQASAVYENYHDHMQKNWGASLRKQVAKAKSEKANKSHLTK